MQNTKYFMQLSSLFVMTIYDHLNICIIIYWTILEYIGIYSVLARIVKQIFSAERVNITRQSKVKSHEVK